MEGAEAFPAPKAYVVSGAGIVAVNGTYHLNQLTGFYDMKGHLDGKSTTFAISSIGKEPDRHWRISVKDSDDPIYRSNLVSDSGLPPVRGWWTNDLSNMPVAPIVLSAGETTTDWRDDPQENFSDYKIIISTEVDGVEVVTEYNTHRFVLARGCTYFDNQLHSEHRGGANYVETQSNLSRIPLEPQLAKMFPYLLDYWYGQVFNPLPLGNLLCQTYSQDVVLYQLADYFRASRVLQDLEVAFNNALAEDLDDWVESVHRHNMTAVMEILVTPCAKKLTELGEETLQQLASKITNEQLHRLLQAKDATEAASRKGSELVAAFCSIHQVDIEPFRLLTDAALLPHIEKTSIWPLLGRERELSGPTQGALSSLEARCIVTLAQNFVALEYGDDSPLRKESPVFLVELLKQVAEHQRNAASGDAQEDVRMADENQVGNEQNGVPMAD